MNNNSIKWVVSFLENQKDISSKKRVIKGIAVINGQYYLLDYILFTTFKWYEAKLLTIKEFESAKSESDLKVTYNMYYNSEKNIFTDYEGLPLNIKKNLA